MDLYFLDHLCFFWTLGNINYHITKKSVYFEKRPAIILKFISYITIHYFKKICFLTSVLFWKTFTLSFSQVSADKLLQHAHKHNFGLVWHTNTKST